MTNVIPNSEIVLFQECVQDSKKRRTDRVTNSFWSSKQLTDSSSIEKWLMARKKIGKNAPAHYIQEEVPRMMIPLVIKYFLFLKKWKMNLLIFTERRTKCNLGIASYYLPITDLKKWFEITSQNALFGWSTEFKFGKRFKPSVNRKTDFQHPHWGSPIYHL